jgi:trehalose/maltose transport system permease protein
MSVATGARARPQETAPDREGVFARLKGDFANKERRTAYTMVSPALLLIILIGAWPIIYAIFLSFLRVLPAQGTEFVGIENYTTMFTDTRFHSAVLNTAIFTVASVALEFILGVGIAMAINRGFRGQGATRAIALVPWAFPTVVSAIMWRLMYQQQGGIMAYFATKLQLISGPILASEQATLIAAVFVDVWKTTPFVALLLLAGLQVIPSDVYEAARVDGANAWQQFTRVTLPLLKPAIAVALLFRTLDAWRVYDLFWAMSDRTVESLSTYVFKGVRISQTEFSLGDAAAVFIFFSSLVIAFFFIRGLGTQPAGEG